MKPIYKYTFITIEWLLIAIILVFALLIVLSKFNTPLNIRVFSILSGSMEPIIGTGDLIVSKKQDDYKIEDIITYRTSKSAETYVTHRINSLDEESGEFITKGDSNEDVDGGTVSSSSVIGRVVLSIPYLGKVLAFLNSDVGFILGIVVPATIIAFNEVQTIKDEIKKQFNKNK